MSANLRVYGGGGGIGGDEGCMAGECGVGAGEEGDVREAVDPEEVGQRVSRSWGRSRR